MNRIIRISPADAKRMADGALAAVSKDDIAPILTGALLELDATGAASMTATDRYRVHRIHAKALPGAVGGHEPHGVQLTGDALKFLSVNATRLGHFSVVIITSSVVDDGENGRAAVRIEVRRGDGNSGDEYGLLAFADFQLYGQFPPVHRLFDDLVSATDAETVRLNTSLIASISKLQKRKGSPVEVMQTAKQNGKHGPVVFRFREDAPTEGEPALYAEALIQPQIQPW